MNFRKDIDWKSRRELLDPQRDWKIDTSSYSSDRDKIDNRFALDEIGQTKVVPNVNVGSAYEIFYQHKKTGNRYHKMCETLMKVGTEWIPAIVYRNTQGKIFTRSAEDFEKKFEMIKMKIF